MQRDNEPDLRPVMRLAWPGFVLDLGAGELLAADGRPAELRAQALKVLLILGEHAGQVVGKDELMRRVWGDVIVTEDSLVQAVGDIRRVLGDAKHERVRTVPRRGYLLMIDAGAPPAAASPRRTWPLVLAAVLLLALVAGWLLWPRAEAPPRTLAILPFDKDEATEAWFVDGVTNELTTVVAGWRDVQVIGRGTMATYKGRAVDAREVGRELGVRHVLAGHARRAGDRVSLSVELVDTRDGRIVWTDQREVPRAELGAAVGQVAGGISRALVGGYGDAIAADTRKLDAQQAQADDLALQGMAELLRGVSREHFDGARRIFEAGLAIDADCRRCLAGVSLANSNLALWEWADDRAAAIARAEATLARLDQLAPDMLLAQLAHASLTNLRHTTGPGCLPSATGW